MTKLVGRVRLAKVATFSAMALAIAVQAVPAMAQETLNEARLRKMEAEIRAVQRVVFPGADGKVFTPQITAGTSTAPTVGQPATSAVTDLLARMETLEAQIAKLTGQIEQNSYRITQLETRTGMTPAGTAPLVSEPGAASPASAAAAATPAPAATPAASQANLNAMTGGASVKPAAASPSSDRVKAVRAIEKPQTDDPGDDEYNYGYRLWDAKFFPEAQQELMLFVQKYPKHSRISFARNLLGRAYLDDGKPREAAQWFLQNYQGDKRGGRAPDSLLYLAISMKELKDPKRACIALAEFGDTYAAEAAGRLKGSYDAARNGLKCS